MYLCSGIKRYGEVVEGGMDVGFLRIRLVLYDEDMLGNCCDELFWLRCPDRFGVGIFYEDSDKGN